MIRIGNNHNASAARVVDCVNLKLTEAELAELDNISALNPEYPAWMVDRQLLGRFPETI